MKQLDIFDSQIFVSANTCFSQIICNVWFQLDNFWYVTAIYPDAVACTYNSATLETKFPGGIGSVPVVGNSPSLGGWIVWQHVIQHKERSLTKYWDLTKIQLWTKIPCWAKLATVR